MPPSKPCQFRPGAVTRPAAGFSKGKLFTKCLLRITIVCLPFSLATPSAAKIFHVPKDYASIQKAIDISDRGDTIRVSPGIYYENIRLMDGRNLLGSGADKTILTDDGEGPPDPIILLEGDCLLSGFTITGARGAGVGHAIMIMRGAPQVIDNIIRDNSYTGIGIHSESQMTKALIKGNRIYGNGGAGVANLGEVSKGIIRDNEIYDNTNAGIACTDLSEPLIENNRIYNNGVGIAAKEGAKATIKDNEIVLNKMVGLTILRNAGATVAKNNIKENGTVGLNVDNNSEVWLLENEILDNGAEGVTIKGNSKAYIAFNVISVNIAIAVQVRDSEATFIRNQIYSMNSTLDEVPEDLEAPPTAITESWNSREVHTGVHTKVVSLKNASVVLGGNELSGGIESDAKSRVAEILPEYVPKTIDQLEFSQNKLATAEPTEHGQPAPEDKPTASSFAPPPDLNLPPPPHPTPLFSGCLGGF